LCIEEQLVKVGGEDSSENLGGDKGGREEEISRYLRSDNEIIKA
jgi:hypothetical protein